MATTIGTVLKLLLDDFVRERWGDLVGLCLVGAGIWMIIHFPNDHAIVGEGKAIIGAGLITLRPKSMSGNGNGKHDDEPKPAKGGAKA
jgi:hypothetical protein